ncbi:hypothetical protein HOP50_13g69540 [Chloropicon primus]|uniref:Translin-associated factor X-interacting protein 1 N-terminal domain-containing protein n=1 Tax=Chloropicon primus TaxID=1764295 RepID=A0A5B8MVZ6_9CHLO|nr:hypothetical protein A3770_13p69340 [Chloropicon primus]UPR03624.1 hypothetical protein HOP50_13g69540 [Chloropicon primus]|eukprot:QDZ24416.1 hypothetical protein A3770_13p69340 [Chloropicon primus]
MFKLDGMDVKESARPGSRTVKSRQKSYSNGDDQDGVQVVNWNQQAFKSAEGLSKNKDFRSAAVYAEVKLAEALNKRTLEKKLNGEDDTEGNPDMYRTAFCIHLLGELVGLSGPFGKVLSTVRDEVCKAIYSEYYAAQKEDLIFEQQTFFSALEHVEAEKEELLEEKEQFRQMLEEREGEIDNIDNSIKELTKNLATERQEKAALQEKLDQVEKDLKNRTGEFKLCVDDLKQARQALIRTSDELKDMRSRNTDKSKQLQSLTQEVATLRGQLDSVSKEKNEIQIASAGSASKKELEMAKQTIEELETKITKLSGVDNIMTARSLTPRPDWKKLDPFKVEQQGIAEPPPKTDGSTKAIVGEVVTRLKRSMVNLSLAQKDMSMLRQQNRNALSFLNPDPDPAAFATRILEQLKQNDADKDKGADEKAQGEAAALPSVLGVLSELSQDSIKESKREHEVEPLGAEMVIPRFLRYTKKLTFKLLSRSETKSLITDIWSAKDEYDGLRTRSSTMMEYVFAHLLENYGNRTDMIAEEGYKLFLSVHCYAADGDVLMFKRVLYGEISEECHFDFECLMAALMQEMQSCLKGEDQSSIPKADLFATLDRFFPYMEKEAVEKLKEALAAEQEKDEIEYMLLFDTEDGNETRGQFLDTLLLQYLGDIAKYSNTLKSSLMQVKADENGFAKLADLKDVIANFDARKTEDDVYMYLARGAHLNSVEDVKFYMELGEEVEVSEFIRNLSSKLIRPSKYYVMSSQGGEKDNGDGGFGSGGSTFMTDPELA